MLKEPQIWLALVERWIQGDGACDLQVTHKKHHGLGVSSNPRFRSSVLTTAPQRRVVARSISHIQGPPRHDPPFLAIDPGMFTNNTASVLIFVEGTKADVIDNNTNTQARLGWVAL